MNGIKGSPARMLTKDRVKALCNDLVEGVERRASHPPCCVCVCVCVWRLLYRIQPAINAATNVLAPTQIRDHMASGYPTVDLPPGWQQVVGQADHPPPTGNLSRSATACCMGEGSR
jgi:hypothetical protein